MHSSTSVEDLQAIIDVIPSPVFVKDRQHQMVLLNTSACSFFGHSREVLLASSDFDLFPIDQVEVFHAADDHVFETGEVHENEEQISDAAGRVRHVITRKRRVQLRDEQFLVAVITDVTGYREAEAHNRYLAFHDTLTELPNRALLKERIDQALMRSRRNSERCVLLYVDLDRFKEVNDTHGHQAGDELIRAFASRLSSVVRASDTVARMGGDEFAILLADTGAGFEVEDVCRRILETASQPFELAGAQAFVGASIGVVVAPDQEIPRVELQRRADVALYQAKNEGRGCFRRFTAELDDSIRRRRGLEADLRHALAAGAGDLEVHFQPLLSTYGEKLVAMEALARWRHPRLGLLPPSEFISIAEDSGLIHSLGAWVLERACTVLSRWPEISLAVNLSPVQLRASDLVERILDIVDRSGLARHRLQLEVTEGAILNADSAGAASLRALRQAGLKIVLDDFGTGYSSLTHLQRLEVDKIKIDGSFVQDLGSPEESGAIVQAVASLGRTLGISVAAEGVETDLQRQFLRSTGCTELQGYLFSLPLSEAATVEYLSATMTAHKAA